MADLGAAFGFYPQMKPRRQGNPVDSANLPIDVLRGRLAGLLGAPADILNLLKTPQPTEMFGEVDYTPQTQVPYGTEQLLKELPLAPTSRVGQVAGQAASFVPLNPMPAVRGVQKVGQMAGEELAATMLGQRPNTMMSKVVPQPLFAVPPEQGLLSVKTEPIENLLQIKPQAPVSDIGFYSATEQAALNLNRNKGTGQSFINDIMKAPDVKKEELQFTGLEDFLRDKPNVTKQEVQDYLANNRLDIEEVTLGGNTAPSQDLLSWMNSRSIITPRNPEEWQELSQKLERYAQQHQKAQGAPETSQRYFTLSEEAGRISEGLDAGGSAAGATKYDKYTLAGGENYREILLTFPENMSAYDKYTKSLREKYGQGGFANLPLTDIERARLDKFYAGEDVSPYKSSHFDQKNILAHMRVNDRIDADGKKMLLVEEIQSDWHQAGREKGYKNNVELEKKFDDLSRQHREVVEKRSEIVGVAGKEDEYQALATKEAQLINDMNKLHDTKQYGVPEAPFKDTWYQLALKRLTKYAADNGYDRIGLTTGRQQAERFDLSKQVDELTYKKNPDGTYKVSAQVGGSGNLIGNAIPEEKLSDYVGKEVATKIVDNSGKDVNFGGSGSVSQPKDMWKSLSGIDLKIGGEGMKKYYDEIYPKFLDKYGKKYGASVGETSINVGKAQSKDELAAQVYGRGETYDKLPLFAQKKIDVMFRDMARDEPIRYLDITPQMKQGTSKGQPLFAATPAIPAAGLLDEEKRKEITSLLE